MNTNSKTHDDNLIPLEILSLATSICFYFISCKQSFHLTQIYFLLVLPILNPISNQLFRKISIIIRLLYPQFLNFNKIQTCLYFSSIDLQSIMKNLLLKEVFIVLATILNLFFILLQEIYVLFPLIFLLTMVPMLLNQIKIRMVFLPLYLSLLHFHTSVAITFILFYMRLPMYLVEYILICLHLYLNPVLSSF